MKILSIETKKRNVQRMRHNNEFPSVDTKNCSYDCLTAMLSLSFSKFCQKSNLNSIEYIVPHFKFRVI